MKAIIMAGGEGTRLKSVTGDTPKPMATLAGKPVMEHIVALLRRSGLTDLCVTLRYRPEAIRDYFGDGEKFGVKIQYRVESEPLGTAGGVRACADFYGERDFLVISGDCACDFDLRPLMEAHRRHRPAVTMALYPHPSPLRYGVVVTDSHGRIGGFVEKPCWSRVVSDLVNTGIYVISPDAMQLVPEGENRDFARDLFPALMERGMELRGLPMEGYWCDVGTPADYYRCNLDAVEGRLDLGFEPPAPSQTPEEPRRDFGVTLEHSCTSRARVMRLLSQNLMEAGADFSDGLTLTNESGKVRICPAADGEKLIISARAADESRSRALAEGIDRMISRLQ